MEGTSDGPRNSPVDERLEATEFRRVAVVSNTSRGLDVQEVAAGRGLALLYKRHGDGRRDIYTT